MLNNLQRIITLPALSLNLQKAGALAPVLALMLTLSTSTLYSQPALAKADSISGTIKVAKSLRKKIPAQGTLYVYVRMKDQAAGPPIAVKKISPVKFPQKFSLSAADKMIPSMPFKGPFRVVAKLTSNGNAMQKAGSFEGVTTGAGRGKKNIEPGSSGVIVEIDKAN